jgi:hypothetical protein
MGGRTLPPADASSPASSFIYLACNFRFFLSAFYSQAASAMVFFMAPPS